MEKDFGHLDFGYGQRTWSWSIVYQPSLLRKIVVNGERAYGQKKLP